MSAAWSHLDYPVGRADDVGVVLYDDDGVALVHEFVEHFEQDANIFEMQSRSRLVEDVKRATCVFAGKFCGKLNSLTLTSGKGVAGLAKLDVAQPDFLQDLYLIKYCGLILKELDGLIDGHIENIRDTLASETHLERLPVVTLPSAFLARHKDIGQEVHLDSAIAVASASFASAAFHVERESTWLVTSDASLGQFDEKLANIGKNVCISGWI